MGIVGVVALAVVLPVIAFFIWRYRRAKQGSKIISGQRRSIFDLPSPALRTTPFYLNSPSSKPGDSEANLVSDVIFTRGSISGTSSTGTSGVSALSDTCTKFSVASPVSQTQPRIIQEKPRVAGVDYQPISPNSDGSSRGTRVSQFKHARWLLNCCSRSAGLHGPALSASTASRSCTYDCRSSRTCAARDCAADGSFSTGSEGERSTSEVPCILFLSMNTPSFSRSWHDGHPITNIERDPEHCCKVPSYYIPIALALLHPTLIMLSSCIRCIIIVLSWSCYHSLSSKLRLVVISLGDH